MSLFVKLQDAFTDATLPVLQRDPVIVSGTVFCTDIGNSYSWAGGNPANGNPVRDLTSAGADGSAVITAGNIVVAGGGFDFSGGLDGGASFIKAPGGILSGMLAAQNFLGCWWVKFPSSTDWSNSTSNPSTQQRVFAQLGGDNNHYASGTGKVLCYMAQIRAGAAPLLYWGRQLTSGTSTTLSTNTGDLAPYFSTVVQVGIWRNGNEFAGRIKNAAGTLSRTQAPGALNAADFSATYSSIGVVEHSVRIQGSERNGFRFYRMFVENLSVSGRNPTTVLDDDYTRTVARNAFS